ncbi:MAG: 30S ribosome-binding factor RbfA [Deltaproteobacteria bacterium]|nr:30S ribosome-binding factor RbfA [Deltaproteobacteria bacterium]
MKTGRTERIAEEIRKAVTEIIQFEMSDPRVDGVVVTSVKVTADLSLARVYFSILDPPENKNEALKALKHAAGHIRHQVSESVTLKYMPQFEFFYDESLELQQKMDQLFEQISPKTPSDNGPE